ncbi:MAG: hypothetical protein HY660_18105 [Armatimonadetes bacterium]|nr:hypothetical protein [Armatimonadota bacterium]
MKARKPIPAAVAAAIVIVVAFAGDMLAAPGRPSKITVYRLDHDSAGYLEKVNNIYNLGIVSNDPNVLKAEYEAGFIQGRLQKSQLAATRDNLWDGLTLVDPSSYKRIPPTRRELTDVQKALARNYTYTLAYISRQTDLKLREQMTRLVFRLVGIYHGATLNAPRALRFDGTWLPGLDSFSPSELRLNYEARAVSFMDVYFLNAGFDVWDVMDDQFGRTKCSAFVKKTGGEIFLTHNSWFDYLNESMATTYYINGDYLTVNAIAPGNIGSATDFGYNNKGIIFNETTHYATYTQTKVDALWMFFRATLAEQFAGSLEEFYRLVSLEASGTYMNGYMVVDTNTREIGLVEMSYKSFVFFKPDGKGGYDVITKPDGLSRAYDRQLLQPDYILGINFPVSTAIRQELKAIENRPMRRRQFLARIGGVKDIESAKALITYTDPKEPLSIYGRWDLGFGTTNTPKKVPEGSVDAKAVSTSMLAYTRNLKGVLDTQSPNRIFWMKFGTPVFNGKPFVWSQSPWKGQKLRGVPDVVDGRWTLLNAYVR